MCAQADDVPTMDKMVVVVLGIVNYSGYFYPLIVIRQVIHIYCIKYLILRIHSQPPQKYVKYYKQIGIGV